MIGVKLSRGLVILLFVTVWFVMGSTLPEKPDPVLDYTLKLVEANKSDKLDVDEKYKELVVAYLKLKEIDNAVAIYKKIQDDYERVDALRQFIVASVEDDRIEVEELVNSAPIPQSVENKFLLFRLQLGWWLAHSKRNELIEKLLKDIWVLFPQFEEYDRLLYWADMLDLCSLLSVNGFDEECGKIFKGAKSFVKKNFDLPMAIFYNTNYFSVYHGIDREIFNLGVEHASDNVSDIMDIAIFLRQIGNVSESNDLMKRAFDILNRKKDVAKRLDILTWIIFMAVPSEVKVLGSDQLFLTNLMKCLGDWKAELTESDLSFKCKLLVEFLYQTDNMDKASEVLAALKPFGCEYCEDIVTYYRALSFYWNPEMLLVSAGKVRSRSMAIQLVLEAAELYKSRPKGQLGYKFALEYAVRILAERKQDNRSPVSAPNLMLELVNANQLTLALKVAKIEDDRIAQEYKYLLLSLSYAKQGNIERAMDMFEFLFPKHLTLDVKITIAAWLMVNGKSKEGIELFKELIQIFIQNKYSGFDQILSAYCMAKAEKRVYAGFLDN